LDKDAEIQGKEMLELDWDSATDSGWVMDLG
jgi:hypothetical protein